MNGQQHQGKVDVFQDFIFEVQVIWVNLIQLKTKDEEIKEAENGAQNMIALLLIEETIIAR